jgi:transposase InsO family protein
MQERVWTWSKATSRFMRWIRCGSATSPTSEPKRVGSTWCASWMPARGAFLAMRWVRQWTPSCSSTHSIRPRIYAAGFCWAETIFHSDHGSQDTSDLFRDALRLPCIRQSMRTLGDSYDKPMAESLWASRKRELIYRTTLSTREEARTAIFDWINRYNKTRRHSGIKYLSPIQFEQGARVQAA